MILHIQEAEGTDEAKLRLAMTPHSLGGGGGGGGGGGREEVPTKYYPNT